MNSLETTIRNVLTQAGKKLEELPSLPIFRRKLMIAAGLILAGTACEITITPPSAPGTTVVPEQVPPTGKGISGEITIEDGDEEKNGTDPADAADFEPTAEAQMEDRKWWANEGAMRKDFIAGYETSYLRYYKAEQEAKHNAGTSSDEKFESFEGVDALTEAEVIHCVRTTFVAGKKGTKPVSQKFWIDGIEHDLSGKAPMDELHSPIVVDANGTSVNMFVAVAVPKDEKAKIQFRWDYGENSEREPRVSSTYDSYWYSFRLDHPFYLKASETGTHTFTVWWLDAPGGEKEICRREFEVISQ